MSQSAASAAALPVPPRTMVLGLASAVPANLSHAPISGILGVVLGAGVVTLAGRLLSLGLADLKGNIGISFDAGAWLSTAFNVGLMFIAIFTVYLGALLGPRRVLLGAAAIFTLVSLYLPFVHSYSLMIVLLAIAGLSSGTFYPLTLTFALRNIPLPFLPYTIALYATSVEAAVNFAPFLYGFERDQLSWHWMFWTAAVITPVMMMCIYHGIPPSSRPAGTRPAPPSFAGVFYLSIGFALLYAALDQGQRLDWWRSGVFTSLFLAGSLLLLSSLFRRLRGANPLVALPYLHKWNTQVCAFLLFLFRFSLLATIIVIPGSLAVRGLEPSQYAPAVLWTAVPELGLAFLGAYLLSRGMDTRLILAFGFACTGLACWLNATYSADWSAQNYFRTELLTAVGQSFAFLGLVSTLILQGLFTGGLAKPPWILTFSAFFHTVRLFGGQIGVVLMTHFIADREKLHSNLLGLHVQRGASITDANLHGLTAALASKSAGLGAATGRAAGVIGGRIRLEAYALTYIDAFYFIAWACVLALLLIAVLRRSPLNYAQIIQLQAVSEKNKEAQS
jgi:DHA2 family multidrug resistance protein